MLVRCPPTRPLAVLLTALLGLLAAATMTAATAMAHASLVGSDPADGGTLAAGAERLSLTFTEDVNPDFAIITLTDADGDQVELAPAVVDGPELVQPLPALTSGALTVAYRVVSADGHPVQGTLSITAEGAADAPPADVAPRTAAGSDESSTGSGWWIGAAAAAGVVVVGGVLRGRRRS